MKINASVWYEAIRRLPASGRCSYIFMHCIWCCSSRGNVLISATQPAQELMLSLIRNIYCHSLPFKLSFEATCLHGCSPAFNWNLFQLPIRFALSLALIAHNGSFCWKHYTFNENPTHFTLFAERKTTWGRRRNAKNQLFSNNLIWRFNPKAF